MFNKINLRSIKSYFKTMFIRTVLKPLIGRFFSYNEIGNFMEMIDTKSFFTYHLRPRKASDISIISNNNIPPMKMAIVMQGPIMMENNFTVETLSLYKKTFKGAMLILSTWKGEDEFIIKKVKELGVKVVLNDLPDIESGPSNMNLQLKSTRSGLMYAYNNKAEYSLKTRSDQRFYKKDLFDLFMVLLTVFPLDNGINQQKRLITTSWNSFKYKMYRINDTFMFGDTKDMLNYWNVDYCVGGIEQYINDKIIQPNISIPKIIPEIYFMINYMKKIGIPAEWTSEHYWDICRDHFIFVDSSMLDFYFPKFYREREYRFSGSKTKNYKEKDKLNENIEFLDWLQLYVNQGIR